MTLIWLKTQILFWMTLRQLTRGLIVILSHPDAVIGAGLIAFLFWLADQPYKGT